MTYTEAVDLLEKHGIKVALGGNGLGLVKQCAQLIESLEGSPTLPLVGRFNVKDLANGDILIFRDATGQISGEVLLNLRKRLLELCPDLDHRNILFISLPADEEETTVEFARFPQRLKLLKLLLGTFPKEERRAFLKEMIADYPVGTFD